MAKPKNPRPDIGRRVAELMEASTDLKTQQALEKRAGVSQATIGRILRGEVCPGVDVAEKLADALGSTIEWIATGRGLMWHAKGAGKSGNLASHFARLDPAKVADTTKALVIVLGRRGVSSATLDLTDPIDAELFAEAYAELDAMDDAPGGELALGAVVADLVAKREERRNARGKGEQAGSVDRAEDRKAGAGR
jgi:transcriptional regulator with XRE-family HTH domain